MKKYLFIIYIKITFHILRLCVFINKYNSILFSYFNNLIISILVLILFNTISTFIIVFYFFITSIFFIFDNLKSVFYKFSILLILFTLNYLFYNYDIILSYKTLRWLLLIFYLFFPIKDKILSFISKNYIIYKDKKFIFILIIINEILRLLIYIYAKRIKKQYNKATIKINKL